MSGIIDSVDRIGIVTKATVIVAVLGVALWWPSDSRATGTGGSGALSNPGSGAATVTLPPLTYLSRYNGQAVNSLSPSRPAAIDLTFSAIGRHPNGRMEIDPPLQGSGALTGRWGRDSLILRTTDTSGDTIRWAAALGPHELTGAYRIIGGRFVGQRGHWHAMLSAGSPLLAPRTLSSSPVGQVGQSDSAKLVTGDSTEHPRLVDSLGRSPARSRGAARPAKDQAFAIGSTKSDVMSAQGKPTATRVIEGSGQEIWTYGASTVTFATANGSVTGWNDLAGGLHVDLGPQGKWSESFFSLGSPKNAVLDIQGTPTAVTSSAAPNDETWRYGTSSVSFDATTGLVTGWGNFDGRLKVEMEDRRLSSADSIQVGSTRDDVVHILGTPVWVNVHSAAGMETWGYSTATVTFAASGLVNEFIDNTRPVKSR